MRCAEVLRLVVEDRALPVARHGHVVVLEDVEEHGLLGAHVAPEVGHELPVLIGVRQHGPGALEGGAPEEGVREDRRCVRRGVEALEEGQLLGVGLLGPALRRGHADLEAGVAVRKILEHCILQNKKKSGSRNQQINCV